MWNTEESRSSRKCGTRSLRQNSEKVVGLLLKENGRKEVNLNSINIEEKVTVISETNFIREGYPM